MLEIAADLVNPILGVCALIAGYRVGRKEWWLAGILGLVMSYAVHWIDHVAHIWPQGGLDFSAHTAVGVSLSISTIMASRRWALFVLPLLVAYFFVMVHLHDKNAGADYHSWADILTTTAAAAALTLLAFRLPWTRAST